MEIIISIIALSIFVSIAKIIYSLVQKYFAPKPFVEFVNNLYYDKKEISLYEKRTLIEHYSDLPKNERITLDENPKLHSDKLISSLK